MIGTMFTWSEGEAFCENEITGHKAKVYLHPRSAGVFKGTNDYTMDGQILDPNGTLLYTLQGKWSDHMKATKVET